MPSRGMAHGGVMCCFEGRILRAAVLAAIRVVEDGRRT